MVFLLSALNLVRIPQGIDVSFRFAQGSNRKGARQRQADTLGGEGQKKAIETLTWQKIPEYQKKEYPLMWMSKTKAPT